MTGSKGHQLPLRVEGQGGDHGWRLALDQGEGLETWRKLDWLLTHIQSSMALEHKERINCERRSRLDDSGTVTVREEAV